MMVKKRWRCVAMALSFCLTLSMMVGCRGDGGSSGSKPAESGGENAAFDLNGATVVLGSYNDLTPNETSATYAQEIALKEEIEAKYHCKLEFYTTNDWHTWNSTISIMALSGEKVADAFCHTIDYVVPGWINSELVAPLDAYFDLSQPMWNKQAMTPWVLDGKNYMVSTALDGLGSCILFNKRLCAEYGITDTSLYELQEKGEWTWNKLLELAKACTKDTNNDGETDVWGFGAYGVAPVSAEAFIYANGSSTVKLDDKLHYTYNLDDPAAIEALEFCRMLANDSGVCYKGEYEWGSWEKLWNKGQVAFYQTYSWVIAPYTVNLADDEFGMLLIPKGPQASDYVNAQNVHDGWFIQPMVENKEAVAAILTDWLYPYDWKENTEPWMYFRNLVFDDQSLETIKKIDGRSVLALGEPATWFRDNILWNDFGVNNNTPARTFAETNKAPSQAAFDELNTNFFEGLESSAAE